VFSASSLFNNANSNMQTDTISSILGKQASLRSLACGFTANSGGSSRPLSCSASALKELDVVFSVGIRSQCDDTSAAAAFSSSACSNVDPCLSNNCDGTKATCRRKGESFMCECKPGYSGTGTTGTCVDIDECATGCHTCSAAQTCVNYNLHSSPWKRFDCVDKLVAYNTFISETTQTLTLKTWASAASPNLCITHRQLLWHAGLGYFFFLGGWGGPCASPGSYSCRSYVHRVSPGSAVVQLADAPWAARDRFGAVYFQNKIWVLGGSCGSTFHGYQTLFNDVWSSADGVTWEQLATNAPWSPRCFHSSSVLVWRNQIWIFGGDKSYSSSVMDVWASPDGLDWSSYGVFSAGARGSIAAGVLGVEGNKVCLVTGGGVYSSGSASVVLTSEDGMFWQQVPRRTVQSSTRLHTTSQASEQTSSYGTVNSSLPPRRDFALLSWGGQLYAWGGKSRDAADGYAREVWVSGDCVRWSRVDIGNVSPWTATPIAGVSVAASLGRAAGDIVYISGGHFQSPADSGAPAANPDGNTFVSAS
jgi:hypothetical protein